MSADAAVPTTPPTTYTFGTTANAITGIAASQDSFSSYSRSAYSATSRTPFTVVAGGSGESSGGNAGASFSSTSSNNWWKDLSSGAKIGIYAGAGALGLLIIIIIVALVIRRSRRKRRNAVQLTAANRMTQRSSFASPMHHQSFTALASGPDESPSSTPIRPYAMPSQMGRTESVNSMDKVGNYESTYDTSLFDAYSVHSVPPMYKEDSMAYPPPRQTNLSAAQNPTGDRTPQRYTAAPQGAAQPTSPPYAPHRDPYTQEQRGFQPDYRQHQAAYSNPYSAFAQDDARAPQPLPQHHAHAHEHRHQQSVSSGNSLARDEYTYHSNNTAPRFANYVDNTTNDAHLSYVGLISPSYSSNSLQAPTQQQQQQQQPQIYASQDYSIASRNDRERAYYPQRRLGPGGSYGQYAA